MSHNGAVDIAHAGEAQESGREITPEVFAAYLEGERRAYLTRVDNIDRIIGRNPRRVGCPHCGHVFDPKRVGHYAPNGKGEASVNGER